MALYHHRIDVIGPEHAANISVECLERSNFYDISQSLHIFRGWFDDEDEDDHDNNIITWPLSLPRLDGRSPIPSRDGILEQGCLTASNSDNKILS